MTKILKVKLSQIKLGNNLVRKDLGNLDDLANSIEQTNGVLQPLVFHKGRLYAGKRRLKALQILAKKDPKKYQYVFAVDSECNPLLIQLHENMKRKAFTLEEIVAIKKEVEKYKTLGRPKKGGKLPLFPKGDAREIVSKISNLSERQIDKIQTIVQKGTPEIIKKVNSGSMSTNTAHKLIQMKERHNKKVELPAGEFDVIYADPPLRFENRNVRGSADHHYSTLALAEICRLEVPAAENAVLFLWMPSSMFFDEQTIPTILHKDRGHSSMTDTTLNCILTHWQFEAKTFFVWKKPKIATGSYTRNQHENLIIAYKGKMPTPAKLFSSIIEAQVGKHSKKPDIVYSMIEEMYPNRKYLELYARQHRTGWKSYGDELEAR